jgi:3-oxoacyl-[acyl-carrier-protein] synthase-1
VKARVYVAGAGAISAIGSTLTEALTSFQQKRSGIGPITHLDTFYKDKLPVGEVKLDNRQLRNVIQQGEEVPRTALLGIHAAREALTNSGIAGIKKWRTGLISATTVGGMDKTESFFSEFLENPSHGRLHDIVNHECARPTELIADALGVDGFVSTINTACSSSVNSIALGARMIAAGKLDVVIAGGADALTLFTLNGFNSLMILDKEPCRPFDASRSGLNLGEGAGFLVLASENVLKEESLSPWCVVSGFANTNDAFHQTASSPEGRGSYAAMLQALQMGGLKKEDIGYINLHGTGTVNNDQSEATAISRLFESQIPRVSSTKSFTGHTLGACGGVEAAFSVLALKHDCVFPNLRFREPIPELKVIPEADFVSGIKLNHVMSNSFGFGGNCSSIIFSKT